MSFYSMIIYAPIIIFVGFILRIFFYKNITSSVISWSIVMLTALVFLTYAMIEIFEQEAALMSENNLAEKCSAMSSICILTTCIVSLRKIWINRNKDSK